MSGFKSDRLPILPIRANFLSMLDNGARRVILCYTYPAAFVGIIIKITADVYIE